MLVSVNKNSEKRKVYGLSKKTEKVGKSPKYLSDHPANEVLQEKENENVSEEDKYNFWKEKQLIWVKKKENL